VPAQYLFPDSARFTLDNLMLHARARRHTTTDFAGPLSIKTVIQGSVVWRVAGRDLPVDASSFLVLGPGERYSLAIDSPRAVETACAFFRDGFVEAAVRDASTPVQSALDDPRRPAPALPWLSRLHPDPEGRIIGRVQTMARRCRAEILPSSFEEGFLLLARDLLLHYREIAARMERIPALKAATRAELFRRVEIAREYLHAQSSGPVSLEEAARVACLSPFHFHRAFTQAHRSTPHAYLTTLRLARARVLLEGGVSVTDAALDTGFATPSAFSRQFRAHYGQPPGSVRARRYHGRSA
jgi:AraC-like DNA-binding protein